MGATVIVSHQTVRLSAGKHHSPDKGVCVMELASMLAGERYTDRPRSACPVIGSFLRQYNDRTDDERRQDLYEYASRVVGTRGDRALARRRAAACLDFIRARRRMDALELWPCWTLRWRTCAIAQSAGVIAARDATDEGHRAALALVDALIDMAPRSDTPVAPPTPRSVDAFLLPTV